jgi:hypothetical protein
MSASNRATLATMIAILLGVTAARCSDAAGGSQSSASAQSGDKSSGKKIDANLTDLPTYPNLTSGSMMGHPPTQGGVYNATTNDAYATVVEWYRSRLQGAKEEHSGYIDTTTGRKEIEFHLAKWNEQVVISSEPATPGTAFVLGQDAH